ncbi:DUF3099 domain-containing protein [Leucobacter sp. GX24907]
MGESYRVTTVGMAPAEDRAKRMRFYYMAMGLRMLCVASLLFVRGWWIAVALLGAVLLPYFAVMIANAVAATPDEEVDAPEPLSIAGSDSGTASSTSPADRPPVIVVDAPGHEETWRSSPAETASSETVSDQPVQGGTEDGHSKSDGSTG